MHRHPARRLGMLGSGAGLQHLGGQARLRDLGIVRRGGHVGGSLWSLGDVEQLDVEHQHALGPVGLAGIGELLGNPQAALLAHDHQLQAFGPALDHLAEAEGRRLPATYRAVEHLAVRRPAAVVHGHRIGRLRVLAASARREHFRGQARGLHLGVVRRRRHVGRSLRRLEDLEELDVEHQHAGRTPLLPAIGEILGNPETALLTYHHQLQALGPARDHPVEGKGGFLLAGDGAVEHLAVRRPARVVHGHRVGFRRVCLSGAGLQNLGGQTGRSHLGVFRRRRHVGRGGNVLRQGRRPHDQGHE